MTTSPYQKQEFSTANLFLQQKYCLNCLFTLEGHLDKKKIESLFENSPISLDVTGAWISSVMNTTFFTEGKLSFSFEGKQLKKLAFEFSTPQQNLRV